MRHPVRFLLTLLVILPIIAAIIGWIVAPWFLHPMRRALTADLIHNADVAFAQVHAKREDFRVVARDGVTLRGAVGAAQRRLDLVVSRRWGQP
jgi:hypothetical protein